MTAAGKRRMAAALWCAMIVATNACDADERYRATSQATGGDPARGAVLLGHYGCDRCHVIPGISTATSLVGPPLTAMSARVYLAGELVNTPANMEAWIRHPRVVEPHTAMPDTGVTEGDARDITAYLYLLR
jgi:cytochrome c1